MTEQITASAESKAPNNNGLPHLLEDKVMVDKAYVLPVAGAEVYPLATLASLDFMDTGEAPGVFELGLENTVGSVLVICAYQSLLTALKSESARREGQITRRQQVQLITKTAYKTGQSSAFTLVICSALIVVFPWLTPIFAVLGVVGGTAMACRITNEFWSALDASQQQELRNAAAKARISLDKIIPTPSPTTLQPAGAGA
jgi:hypothetical protein